MRAHRPIRHILSIAGAAILLLVSTQGCTTAVAAIVNRNVLEEAHRRNPTLFAEAGFETAPTPNWPPPIMSEEIGERSLRNVLNRHFGRHAAGCELATEDPERDFVPRDIRSFTRTDLGQEVTELDVSGRSLAFFVHTTRERDDPFDKIVPVPSRVFANPADAAALGLDSEFHIASESGFPAWVSRRNCLTYLNAALQAELVLPPASLRTALDADMDRKSTIVVVEGWFVSPLVGLIRGAGWRNTYARLLLWELYRDEEELRDGAYYLKEFRGMTIARALDRESARRVEAAIDLNQSLPIARIAGSGEAGSRAFNRFGVRDWSTVIYDVFSPEYPRKNAYDRLPSVDDLRDHFAEIAFIPGQERPMSNGARHTHWFDIEGVPERMCNNEFWEISDVVPGVYRNTPDITLTPQPINGTVCRFEVSGFPEPDLFPGEPRIQVSYMIRTKTPVSVGDQRLERWIDVPIETVNEPRPLWRDDLPVSFQHVPAHERKFGLRWDVQIGFADANNPVLYSGGARTSDEEVSLTCGGESIEAIAEGGAGSAGGERHYEIIIRSAHTLSHEVLDVTRPDQDCVLNLQMSVPLERGGRAPVTVSGIRLQYPASLSAVAAAAPADPQ